MRRIDRIPVRVKSDVREELKNISTSIQRRREIIGLTQEELAEKIEISVETLKKIEQGSRYPSLPMLFYIFGRLHLKLQIVTVERKNGTKKEKQHSVF